MNTQPTRNRKLLEKSNFSWLFTIIVPGSGQVIAGKTWRGITIFLCTIILGFLVRWSFSNYEIAKVTLGQTTTFSWLWIMFAIFYLWNILDASPIARSWKIPGIVPFLFAAVILYVIAFRVTGVKMDRLVTRFDDAKVVARKLINPDFLSVYEGEKAVVCSWD